MLPIISFFGRPIGTYGLLACLGILVACFISCYFIKKKVGYFEDAIFLFILIGIGAFAGGHFLYGLTNIGKFLTYFNAGGFIFAVQYTFGGSVFYGGLIGGILLGWIGVKALRLDRKVYADAIAVVVPLFHAFGRVGCFLGGCCYGVESKLGFITHTNPLVPSINGVRRFPVQLLEALLCLIIFVALLTLYRQNKFKGRLLAVYLLMYAPIRFFDEFLRGDEIRGFAFGLSTSQLISVLIKIALIAYIITVYTKKHKDKSCC